MSSIKTAFVAGAGLGKRLRPLTEFRPKPLVPFFNQPLICRTFAALASVGIERVVINTHHCASRYDDLLGLTAGIGRFGKLEIQCIHEPILLETGGGIRNASPLFRDESVLVHNGDIFTSVDLAGLIKQHQSGANEVTAHLRSQGGPLQISYDAPTRTIRDFRHSLGQSGTMECLFSGIYIVESNFVSRIPENEIISVVPVFLDMLRAGVPMGGFLDDTGA
ncbi:MAG: sugar phosphate nucleotidyltransferase [Chthoniobacterales bacterium]